jgi:hypothetical protein
MNDLKGSQFSNSVLRDLTASHIRNLSQRAQGKGLLSLGHQTTSTGPAQLVPGRVGKKQK